MMYIRNIGIFIIIITMITGCASAPNLRYVDRHDPIVEHSDSVALLVDVCDQIDVVGKGDYCIISESKEVASSLTEKIKSYLKLNGISIEREMIPFVCGAFESPENLPVKVAEKKGDTVEETSKPFSISDEIKKDVVYLNALTTLSTYVFERSMIKYLKDSSKKNDEFQTPELIVQEDQFREAVEVIKSRIEASKLLYVGIKGSKDSGGKKFGKGLMSFTVGMATAITTAGLGTGYYAYFMPGFNGDSWYDTAGLINLETKELAWKNYSFSQGNPLEAKNVANDQQCGFLLNDLFFVKEQMP